MTQPAGAEWGTADYSAPEVRDGNPGTEASDVWSFGAVALELFTGRLPKYGLPEGQFAGPLTDVIRACLQDSGRPTTAQVLAEFTAVRNQGFDNAVTNYDAPPQTPTVPHRQTEAATPTRKNPWLIPALAALVLVAIVVTGLVFMLPRSSANTAAGPQPDTSPGPSEITTTTTPSATSSSPTPTPTPTVSSPTPTSTSPSPTPSPTQAPITTTFTIETKLAEPVIVGKELGPGYYGLGSSGKADIAYNWTGYSSTGTKMNSTDCQMVATISGPQSFPVYRTSRCSERFANSFNGLETGLEVTVPGVYTISVIDEITGAKGTASFTVAR